MGDAFLDRCSDGGLENGVADENAFRMVDDRKRCQAEILNI